MDDATLRRAVEAVLFACSEPLPLARLEAVFAPDGVEPARLTAALEALGAASDDRGVEVQEVAGGWQLRTRSAFAGWVARLETPKPVRFSRAALETLAVVAYRQPLTRAEVEEVRGVDCGGVLKSLLERGLVRAVGKKDVPGRPLLYGTAKRFLETFGLATLAALPSLRDLGDLAAARAEEEPEPGGGEAAPLLPLASAEEDDGR
ncbi:MAG: SMC-Scp complex subunit ScpB [Deltaproteobacteria bacterium]|nr:SMC-Scp complex subunit ScpB [Deltaproteobacteria bacterium]